MPEKHSYLFGQIYWLGFQRAIVQYDGPAHERSIGLTFWRKVKYFLDAFTASPTCRCAPPRPRCALGLSLCYAAFVAGCVCSGTSRCPALRR